VGELRDSIPMFLTFQSEAQTPEQAREVLNESTVFIQTVLADTGGRVVSIETSRQTNVIFSAFGAPITYGDDAERAVSAALALREWGQHHPGIHSIRIGISRGLLYAGVVGGEVRHEYSTIGDETNLAARLMVNAQPNQILVTPRVRNETRQRVKYRDLQPIRVKGREDEITVSEPFARVSGAHRRALNGDLIGRASELAQIQKLLKAVGMNLPRVLRVEGQAGIGKSRLVNELETLAAERGLKVVSGDCRSTERSTAYLPWREIVADLIGFMPDESVDDESISRLSVILHELNPDWLVRLPLLADVLNIRIPETPATESLRGQTRKQAVFTLITDIVMACARRRPVVIIIEDIHWIDEVSEALASELARRLMIDPEPVLLTLVHRPLSEFDHDVGVIPLISELYIHSAISLTDLSRPEVGQLLESNLKAKIPPELTDFVYQKAQGNPFFINEVLDTLKETGMIQVREGKAHIERDLDTADLPRTVQEIVQARIDRLSETDKLVLKVAAVIGFSFGVHVLAEALPIPLDYDEILMALRRLEEREFVHIDDAKPDLTYAFKHTIIQEVTYQNLLYTQRIDLHRAVGSVLERLSPDAVEQLAYHFSQTDDKPATWRYLLSAARKCQREFTNMAALNYYEKLLQLSNANDPSLASLITSVELFDIRSERLRIMLRIGAAERAQGELGELARLTAWTDRTDWQIITKNFRAQYFIQLNRWQEALDEAADAVTLATAIQHDELTWDSYMLLCDVYRNLNMRLSLQAVLPQLHVLVERLKDPRKQISLMLQELDDIYMESTGAARRRAQIALVQAEELDDRPLIAECLGALGAILGRDNDRAAALGVFRRQLDFIRQIGDRRGEGEALTNIGIVLVDLGQLSEANSYLLDGYKILHQVGAAAGEARSLVYLGLIAAHRRAYDEALAYAMRGLGGLRALGVTVSISQALLNIGNIYLCRRDLKHAVAYFNEARTGFETGGYLPLLAETDTALAEIDLMTGDLDSARQRIATMRRLLEEQRYSFLLHPGLDFWRVVQVLDRLGLFTEADRLRGLFRTYSEKMLAALPDSSFRDGFRQNIWYHQALLTPLYA
jgi:class 3 adenylate cyclase/tetratricopeptide (TPR) repeat protein